MRMRCSKLLASLRFLAKTKTVYLQRKEELYEFFQESRLHKIKFQLQILINSGMNFQFCFHILWNLFGSDIHFFSNVVLDKSSK